MNIDRFSVRLFNTVEPVTTFYRDLVPYWEKLGWEVHVIISKAVYRTGRDESWRSSQTNVHYAPAFGLSASGRTAKLLIMLSYIFFAAFLSLLGPRVDRNIFLTQPPLFFVWGWVLQKLRGQPYYIVLMDLYPHVAIKGGVLTAHSLPANLLQALSHFGLCKADGVIVIGQCMADKVVKIGVEKERVHMIPNWSDEEKVIALEHGQNDFRQEMGWQDKFVVLYSGNIGAAHYFDDILQTSHRLRKQTDLLFVFIGHGSRRKEIEQFQEQNHLTNIQLLPFQPQERLAETLSAADLHFVSLRKDFAGLVVPSKAYGVLAVGRPILYQGESHGEIARLIETEGVGTVISLEDTVGLEAAIGAYLKNRSRAKIEGKKARMLAESVYSKMAACQRYTSVLN